MCTLSGVSDLTAVRLRSSKQEVSSNSPYAESVELQEGLASDVAIGLQITGHVPRYKVSCMR